jgi:hypothetical protein
MKKTLAAIVMGTVLAVGSTNAAIVFGNLGANGTDGFDTVYRGLSTSSWTAVGFTTDSFFLGLQSVNIGLEGSGSVRLDLYTSVTGGSPSPRPGVATGSFATATYATGEDVPLSVAFNLNAALAPNTTYFLVASRLSGTANWAINQGASSPTAQNLSSWSWANNLTTSNSGAVWSEGGLIAGVIDSVSVSVTAIPEPGTWAAMAILAGGAAFAGWRRRQQQVA